MTGQWVVEESKTGGVFGYAQSYQVEAKLYDEKTPYQHLEVYRTINFGNLMILDGVFQNTEADEFTYHEMIAHVPLFSHPKPERVLIIGGGDGGVAREVLKHQTVQECILVDIDPAVTKVARKYFKNIAKELDNPRLQINHDDGAKFVKNFTHYFDVILIDSSDPIGPNESLFREEFYRDVHKALKKDGIAVAQGESMILHLNAVRSVIEKNKAIWDDVDYYWHLIPVYPSGNIGLITMVKGRFDVHQIHEDRRGDYENLVTVLDYYTADIHSAAFVKPAFFNKCKSIPSSFK